MAVQKNKYSLKNKKEIYKRIKEKKIKQFFSLRQCYFCYKILRQKHYNCLCNFKI